MFAIFKLFVTIAVLRWIFVRESPDEKLVKGAARADVSDKDAVARAYWKLHQETYVPNSRWIVMKREEKAAIFAKREELERQFKAFSEEVKQHVRNMKSTQSGR